MKVFVLDPTHRSELERLVPGVEVVAEPAPDVEFAVLGFLPEGRLRALLDALPGLKAVQSLNAGIEWLAPFAPPGAVVSAAVGVHDGPVSEWVVAAVLATQRRLPAFLEQQRRAEWNRRVVEEPRVDDLDGQTAVVVGYGSIGRALAARLAPFGVRIVGVAQHSRADAQPPSALPQLLPQADLVVDLLPITPETRRFCDRAFFAQMKDGALFVNAGRGQTVDTDALVEALRSGRLRAALDVTDPEPLPPDHPLWRAPNVLITPHVAGAVARWQERGNRFAAQQIPRYMAGEPLLGVHPHLPT